jgi:hypothetical protein
MSNVVDCLETVQNGGPEFFGREGAVVLKMVEIRPIVY